MIFVLILFLLFILYYYFCITIFYYYATTAVTPTHMDYFQSNPILDKFGFFLHIPFHLPPSFNGITPSGKVGIRAGTGTKWKELIQASNLPAKPWIFKYLNVWDGKSLNDSSGILPAGWAWGVQVCTRVTVSHSPFWNIAAG